MIFADQGAAPPAPPGSLSNRPDSREQDMRSVVPYVGLHKGGPRMSPKTPAPPPAPEFINAAEDWLFIQHAIGDALRNSVEQVAEEPLPGAVALLLVRLAFAEILQGVAVEKIQTAGVEVELIEARSTISESPAATAINDESWTKPE
jgi:hypothetical protein